MRYRPLLLTAVFVAAADALTKAAAVVGSRWMPVRLPGGWALQTVHNNGVILGLGAGTALPGVFAIIGAAEIVVLLAAYRHERGLPWAVALGLTLGGTAGNLGEHQVFGYVVDWIRPPQPNIVFDLADVAIALGQVLLITLLLLSLRTSKARTRAAVTR